MFPSVPAGEVKAQAQTLWWLQLGGWQRFSCRTPCKLHLLTVLLALWLRNGNNGFSHSSGELYSHFKVKVATCALAGAVLLQTLSLHLSWGSAGVIWEPDSKGRGREGEDAPCTQRRAVSLL